MLPRRGYEQVGDENEQRQGGASTTVAGYDALQKDDESEPSLSIKVLDVQGQTYSLILAMDATVRTLKARLMELANVEVERQRIIHLGRVLDDADVLAENKVKDGTVLHLFQRPKGHIPLADGSLNSAAALARDSAASGVPDGVPHIIVRGDYGGAGGNVFGDAEWQLENARRGLRFLASFLFLVSTMQTLQALAIITSPTEQDVPQVVYAILVRSAMGMSVGVVGIRASHGTEPPVLRLYVWGLIVTGVFAILIRADILWDFMVGYLPLDPPSNSSSYDDDVGAGGGRGGAGNNDNDGGSGGAHRGRGSISSSSSSTSEGAMPTQSDLVFSAFISLCVAALAWTWCSVRAYMYALEIGRGPEGDPEFGLGCWPTTGRGQEQAQPPQPQANPAAEMV